MQWSPRYTSQPLTLDEWSCLAQVGAVYVLPVLDQAACVWAWFYFKYSHGLLKKQPGGRNIFRGKPEEADSGHGNNLHAWSRFRAISSGWDSRAFHGQPSRYVYSGQIEPPIPEQSEPLTMMVF